jgi:hypothetical protein
MVDLVSVSYPQVFLIPRTSSREHLGLFWREKKYKKIQVFFLEETSRIKIAP